MPPVEPLLGEELIPVQDVPARLPPSRGGRRLHRAAVWRWVTHGLRRPDGSRVRLEALRMGRRWVTSTAALGRFFRRLSGAERVSDGSAVATPSAPRADPATVATLARFGLAVTGARASS